MFGNRRVASLHKPYVSRRRIIAAAGGLAGIHALGPLATNANSMSHSSTPEGEDHATYDIEGRLLEVCTCLAICPCWVGEDPDGGTCDSVLGWAVDKGIVEGVDVSGLTLAISVHIPGNVLGGNWRGVVYVDDRSTEQQEAALLKVFTGQLGGAIADLAALITDVIAVERAPIDFAIDGGEGILTIGENTSLKLVPFKGATGNSTVLQESVFSTIPGSPAYVGKAEYFRRNEAEHGLANIDIEGHNAIQGSFRFSA